MKIKIEIDVPGNAKETFAAISEALKKPEDAEVLDYLRPGYYLDLEIPVGSIKITKL